MLVSSEGTRLHAKSEGLRTLLRRRRGCWSGAWGGLFGELKCAGAAENAGAFVAFACAGSFSELRLDVVVVFIAFELGDEACLASGDRALGVKLGAAVALDGAIDDEVAGATLLAVLAVEGTVGNRTWECPLVGGHVGTGLTGHGRGPVAVEASCRGLGREQCGEADCGKAQKSPDSHG